MNKPLPKGIRCPHDDHLCRYDYCKDECLKSKFWGCNADELAEVWNCEHPDIEDSLIDAVVKVRTECESVLAKTQLPKRKERSES